jgi:predicted Zn finger-like uncharacterized protein
MSIPSAHRLQDQFAGPTHMAVSRITCPECKTVLKPTKPVPAGKAVRCPECGTRFNAAEDAAKVPLKKPKAAVAADLKPKKSADKKASPKKPAIIKSDDEEEGGGTYAYMKEEEVAEEDKPDIEYAPDMSTKDLRGPAASALVGPSNWLIVVGALGFFGWMGVLVMILIPTLFPIDADDGDKAKPPKPVIGLDHGLSTVNDEKEPITEPKSDPNRKSFYSFFGSDLSLIGLLPWYFFLLSLLPIFLGMVYSGLVTYGAVQIQNLEGYRWGVASAIMATIPISSWGFMMTTAILLKFLLGMVTDDVLVPMIFLMSVEALAALGVGVWVVTVLMSEKVVKGYAYKAD